MKCQCKDKNYKLHDSQGTKKLKSGLLIRFIFFFSYSPIGLIFQFMNKAPLFPYFEA